MHIEYVNSASVTTVRGNVMFNVYRAPEGPWRENKNEVFLQDCKLCETFVRFRTICRFYATLGYQHYANMPKNKQKNTLCIYLIPLVVNIIKCNSSSCQIYCQIQLDL